VQGFTDAAGITHKPGDIVDLPASYDGEAWLERVESDLKVKVPAAKLEVSEETAAASQVNLEAPLEPKKSKKAK